MYDLEQKVIIRPGFIWGWGEEYGISLLTQQAYLNEFIDRLRLKHFFSFCIITCILIPETRG